MSTTTTSSQRARTELSSKYRTPARREPATNVGQWERLVTGSGGVALLSLGMRRLPSLGGLVGAGIGVALLWRGISGQCAVYEALGIDTSADDESGSKGGNQVRDDEFNGVRSQAKVTIVGHTPEEVYRIWRDFSSQPKFSKSVESVEVLANGNSRWTVRTPIGTTLTWDAEIVNDITGQVIAWRSVEGSGVRNAGAVQFRTAPEGRGVEVEVNWSLEPPMGPLGHAVGRALSGIPATALSVDLRRFKQWVETGEIATIEGQPSARKEGSRQ